LNSSGVDLTFSSTLQESTGVLTGGVLSINGGDDTRFDVTAGTGTIIATGGGKTSVSWGAKTAVFVPKVDILTYIMLDSSANVVTSTTHPANDVFRDNIFLGIIVHTNGTNIDQVNNEQHSVQWPSNNIQDLMHAIGFLNISGNVVTTPAGVSMGFIKTAGEMFGHGVNYENNVKVPNNRQMVYWDSETSDDRFQYRARDGTSSDLLQQFIDPNVLDDGNAWGAFASPVATNKWTAQRVYLFTSGAVKVQAGQEEYKDSAEAALGIQSESFVTEASIVENGMLIGFIIVQEGETDLNNAVFQQAGKFQSGNAGSGSFGDVLGPASSTDNGLARYDGTTGLTIQDSIVTLDDFGGISEVTQLKGDGSSNLQLDPDGTEVEILGDVVIDGGLNMTGTTDTFLPPRVTLAQRRLIVPAAGAHVFDTTVNSLYVGTGGQWVRLMDTDDAWIHPVFDVGGQEVKDNVTITASSFSPTWPDVWHISDNVSNLNGNWWHADDDVGVGFRYTGTNPSVWIGTGDLTGNASIVPGEWIKWVRSDGPKLVTQYKISNRALNKGQEPLDFQLLYSDDGTYWEIANTRTSEVWTTHTETHTIVLDTPISSSYWAVQVSVTTDNLLILAEVRLE